MKRDKFNNFNIQQLQSEIKKNNYKGLIFSSASVLFTIAACTVSFIPPICNIVFSITGTMGIVFSVQNWYESNKNLYNKLYQKSQQYASTPEIIDKTRENEVIDLSFEKGKFFESELTEDSLNQEITKYIDNHKNYLRNNIKFFDEKYKSFGNFQLQSPKDLNFILFCLTVIDNIKQLNNNNQHELLDKKIRLDMMLTLNVIMRQNEKLEISLSDLTKIDDIINLIYNLKDLDPKDYLKNMDEFMNSKRAYTIKKPYEIRDEYVLVSRIFPMAKIQSKMEELNIEISDIVCVDNQEETLLEEVEEAAKIKDEGKVKVKRFERR